MKAIFSVIFFISALFLPAASRAESQYEHILNFDSRISVPTNGTLVVVETIQVFAAGNVIQHGIYRDFPQLYHGRFGLRAKTGFNVQSVRRDGQPEDFHLANRENGVRVYIGSASALVSHGLHTYELAYTTERQLGFFHDHDELYWNVTGNGWMFPMDAVTATVTLPAGAPATNLTAYTGAQGERGRDFKVTNFANTARFTTTRRLPSENGLTIVVEWPKGFVTPPSALAGLLAMLEDNRGAALAASGLLLALFYYLVTWKLIGRDPRPGVIIPRYAPPENFSPAAVRYLKRMGFDNQALSASVLNLAVKGAIKIIEQKEGVFRKKIYTLVPVRNARFEISQAEEIVRRELVGDGLPITLRQENYAAIQSAQKGLRDFLAENIQGQFFKHNFPFSFLGFLICLASVAAQLLDYADSPPMIFLLGVFFIVPIIAIAIGIRIHRFGGFIMAGFVWIAAGVTVPVFQLPAFPIFFAISSATLAAIFHFLLKAYTPEGRKIMDEIVGFKMYLGVAEKDRLNLENPPERTPQLFEMFLPYALALGVEQKWSEQFAGVLAAAGTAPGQTAYSPAWYSGNAWNQIGAASFAGALGGSLAGAISSASTAPGSSSGGGGGGGGGGSSGGGGGGGGGGGW
jgi:uncharacterized membrane protein YgcG